MSYATTHNNSVEDLTPRRNGCYRRGTEEGMIVVNPRIKEVDGVYDARRNVLTEDSHARRECRFRANRPILWTVYIDQPRKTAAMLRTMIDEVLRTGV